jgi:POT family proton-dependent oligopeptide transporter
MVACKVFLVFPIFWLIFQQMQNNLVSQAGTMQLHGLPNDIMQNIDALTIIAFIPICDRIVYPSLRKFGIQFKPITRITWGLALATVAMSYAVYVQRTIYSAAPCFDNPLECDAAVMVDGKREHNHVHVALQIPAYFLVALAEIFAAITGLEYAYTKAPASMKSFIMAMFLLTSAGGAALGAALAPLAKNPQLTWFYLGLAITSGTTTVVFWFLFNKYNNMEDSLNELGAGAERGVRMDRLPTVPLSKSMSSHNLKSLVSGQVKLSFENSRDPTRATTSVEPDG